MSASIKADGGGKRRKTAPSRAVVKDPLAADHDDALHGEGGGNGAGGAAAHALPINGLALADGNFGDIMIKMALLAQTPRALSGEVTLDSLGPEDSQPTLPSLLEVRELLRVPKFSFNTRSISLICLVISTALWDSPPSRCNWHRLFRTNGSVKAAEYDHSVDNDA
jgi:hypothetical protein